MIDTTPTRRCSFLAMLMAGGMLFYAPFVMAQDHSSAQSATTPPGASPDVPKYDVATIKPSSSSSDGRIMMMFTPDGISISGVPLQMIVRDAFHVEEDRILGAPGWVKTNRYDIQAKVAPEDAPKLEKLKMEQRQAMLLPLLVERFNLKYHHETRELPSYSLMVAKGGPKLKPSAVPDPPPSSNPPDAAGTPRPGDGPGNNQPRRMLRFMGRGHLEAEGGNTEMLARVLSQQLGRTVVDKTGLTGTYDYTLQWTPDDAPPSAPGGADGGPPHNEGGTDAASPSLFTAVQEQLGLKLQSEKGQADVIVIDHIDLPSEN
jgi:bla regulator protein blaR1